MRLIRLALPYLKRLRVFHRLKLLTAIAASTTTCYRCGGRYDISVRRSDGVKVMHESGDPTALVIACPACQPVLRSRGFKQAR